MVRRNRTRKQVQAPRVTTTTVTERALVPIGPTTQRVVQQRQVSNRRKRGRNNRLSNQRRMQLSADGVAFLKCAYASPDFGIDPGNGIPDNFTGRVVPIKDCSTTSVTFTPGTDTYILSSPVPGYAYFKCEVPVGNDPQIFTGVTYPTYTQNFGSSTLGNSFTKFRYVSTAIGLYPSSNMMQFSGSVQVWKIDLNHCEELVSGSLLREPSSTTVLNVKLCDDSCTDDTTWVHAAGTDNYHNLVNRKISGLASVTTLAPRDNYSDNFIKGAYSAATDIGEFIWSNFSYSDTLEDPISAKEMKAETGKQLTGVGNLQTIVMKISTPEGAVNSALLKNWTCLEMQPNTNSALYQFARQSPTIDPVAMVVYRRIANELPVAVPANMNAGAWDRTKRIIQGALTIGAATIPGIGGMVAAGAAGVWSLSTGIADLFI